MTAMTDRSSRRTLVVVLLVGVLAGPGLRTLAGPGAPGPPGAALVGRWDPVDGKQRGTLEFTREGVLKVRSLEPDGKEARFEGSFKVVGEGKMEVELAYMGVKTRHVLKYTCQGDELTTTDEKGTVEKFKRVK